MVPVHQGRTRQAGLGLVRTRTAPPVSGHNGFDMMKRHRLTSSQREALWDRECAKAVAGGNGQFPICNLCALPIFPGQRWHESHNKFLPHAIGGDVDGIAHERCNLNHNHTHDTPLVAKVKRIRQKHIGAYRRHETFRGWRKFNGTAVRNPRLPYA